MIELNQVSKSFGPKKVLKQLNLTIPTGSIFGLVGPNGAGKSTLLYLLNGISKTDHGSILYDDQEVYENTKIKNDILLICDDPYFFPHATIHMMRDFYKTWYPSLNEDTLYKYAEIFALPTNKPINDFSKGMKRQTMLAIALSIAPKYLLLDEAFDGLDPVMRLTFKRALTTLIENRDITVIISSHNLRELEDICDCFGILDEGIISTSGDLHETKDHIHKIQLAFKEELDRERFDHLDLLSFKSQSKVITMVVKGDIEDIKTYLYSLKPLMLEVLPVNLEEIFIYEMERKGYGVYEDNQ